MNTELKRKLSLKRKLRKRGLLPEQVEVQKKIKKEKRDKERRLWEEERKNQIGSLPPIEKTDCHMYINGGGRFGCCNQYRNPENYYEIAVTEDGKKIMIAPARSEISGESMVDHHNHCHEGYRGSRWWYVDKGGEMI